MGCSKKDSIFFICRLRSGVFSLVTLFLEGSALNYFSLLKYRRQQFRKKLSFLDPSGLVRALGIYIFLEIIVDSKLKHSRKNSNTGVCRGTCTKFEA